MPASLAIQKSICKSIFMHCFDIHFLGLKQTPSIEKYIENEARNAVKLAVLSADKVLIPVASFFESPLCRRIIEEYKDVYDSGLIWLVGGAINIEEFAYRKMEQYSRRSNQYKLYRLKDITTVPPFLSRAHSSTEDIRRNWIARLHEGSSIRTIADNTAASIPKNFERKWELIPEKLEKRAFIVDYVAPLLLGRERHPILINRLQSILNSDYFDSYVKEFSTSIISNLIYLASPYKMNFVENMVLFKESIDRFRMNNLLNDFVGCVPISLLSHKYDPNWIRCIVYAGNIIMNDNSEEKLNLDSVKKGISMEKLRSFIVHGHDDVVRLSIKNYLQNTLHLSEPTILDEKPNHGKTIIEKFEDYSDPIDVVFILLTPDDTANGKKERARQNVIFELGYFIGKLGRRSGRVILLYKDVEIPTDLDGVIYIDITNGVEASGEKIRKELENLKRIDTENATNHSKP